MTNTNVPTSGEFTLTNEQLQEFRDAFSLFDTDGDGQLLFSELIGLLHALGQYYTTEEVSEIMKDADVGGDGLINFKEFLGIAIRMVADLESVREAFDIVGSDCLQDDDASVGTTIDRISGSSLMKILPQMGETVNFSEDQVEKILRELGIPEDGDGEVTVDAFIKYVTSM
jgi:calmodulin